VALNWHRAARVPCVRVLGVSRTRGGAIHSHPWPWCRQRWGPESRDGSRSTARRCCVLRQSGAKHPLVTHAGVRGSNSRVGLAQNPDWHVRSTSQTLRETASSGTGRTATRTPGIAVRNVQTDRPFLADAARRLLTRPPDDVVSTRLQPGASSAARTGRPTTALLNSGGAPAGGESRRLRRTPHASLLHRVGLAFSRLEARRRADLARTTRR
jgi:hypothetical protein